MGTQRGISAAVMKNIALITMTIDHATAFLLKAYLNAHGVFSLYSSQLYYFGRVIGRIAFVLYAFMIAEGALRTNNKLKYAGRLLVLALISVIPHSYVNNKSFFNPKDLNIFFLLFTGLITIYACQWMKEHISKEILSFTARLAAVALACAISVLCNFEYGLMGILLIMVFYIYRYDFPKMAFWGAIVMTAGYMLNVVARNGFVNWFSRNSSNILGGLWNADKIQVFGLLAFPIIFLYNGKKGKQLPKLFYYLFYPVHLGIIALILYL